MKFTKNLDQNTASLSYLPELEVLSAQEVEQIVKQQQYPKHGLIIQFMHATGITASTLSQLRVRDLVFHHTTMYVRDTCGHLIALPVKLKIALRAWIAGQKLAWDDYLFPTYTKKQLSVRTIGIIIRDALQDVVSPEQKRGIYYVGQQPILRICHSNFMYHEDPTGQI